VGQILMEDIAFDADSGQLISGSFMDYAMPRADDLSSVQVKSNPVPTPTNPLGVKGCGEAGCVGAMPAVANAIVDALSDRVYNTGMAMHPFQCLGVPDVYLTERAIAGLASSDFFDVTGPVRQFDVTLTLDRADPRLRPGTTVKVLLAGRRIDNVLQVPLQAVRLKNGKPAGYDVELVTALAKAMGVKLKIQNLGFNGLIPGLVAKKFDLVSVGLSATPERKKAIDFTRSYVPYALILAVPANDTTPATYPAWNDSSKTITALAGSTDAQLVQSVFPKAKLSPFPDDTTALLQVATGRANAAVIENYLLAQFSKSNPGKLK
jgi:ABC-type amino acid transport substrate-binding protein